MGSKDTGPISPKVLRACREKRGISQADLADILGVDPHTVSRWETGTRKITRMARHCIRLVMSLGHIPRHTLKKMSTTGLEERD
jgi:DNA-binding transcriptional regulator YiaG